MRSAAVVSLALLCGCAHHDPLPAAGAPEQQRFNRDAAGRDVTVTQTDGTQLLVPGPQLRGDSCTGDGATAGVVTGLLLGAIAFMGVAGNCQGTTCSVSSRLPVFLVVIPTGFLGAVIGCAAGSSMRYSIER